MNGDTTVTDVARRLLDAIITRDGAALRRLTGDGFALWKNFDGRARDVDDMIADLEAEATRLPPVTAENVRVHAWHDGFLLMFTMTCPAADDAAFVHICMTGTTVDGRMATLREYADLQQAARFVRTAAAILDGA